MHSSTNHAHKFHKNPRCHCAGRGCLSTPLRSSRRGFTILELLIAMSVFAVIMLIVVSVFIQISRLYFKGVTIARTQEAARTIMDDVTRELQFNGGNLIARAGGGSLRYYCIGNRRYSYLLNVMLTQSPTVGGTDARHVLQKDTISTTGNCPDAATDSTGAIANALELLPDGMSITNFDITCADSKMCNVRLRLVYGNPNDNTIFMDDAGKRVCRGSIVGTEYCAVVELTSFVTRRMQ